MLEIERKFLLKNIPWMEISGPGSLVEEYDITQFYKAGYRYRWEQATGNRPEAYYRIVKTKVEGLVGASNGTEITVITALDFNREINNINRVISKRRKVVRTADPKQFIEVDIFRGFQLVMMEIEIPETDYPLSIPSNIYSQIVAEVTGIKGFSNKALLDGITIKNAITYTNGASTT